MDAHLGVRAAPLLVLAVLALFPLGCVSLVREDFLVKNYAGLGNTTGLTSYAGQIPVREDAALFFWYFPRDDQLPSDNLVAWFNGGPGCTSMDGLILENGPLRFDGSPQLYRNPNSITRVSDVVYVDQPAGTGLSYIAMNGKSASTEYEVAADMEEFFVQFFQIFPELRRKNLYLAGESYAGMYIPYMALRLTDTSHETINVTLAGLIIGSGWMDPMHQYPSYLDVVRKYDVLPASAVSELETLTRTCTSSLRKLDRIPVRVQACERILQVIEDRSIEKNGPGFCVNIYDFRLTDPECGMSWPPGLTQMTGYLSRDDVRANLNVKRFDEFRFVECNSRVYESLTEYNIEASSALIPSLLSKMRVLFFVGDKDLICNYMGIESMIADMNWNGQKGLQDAPYLSWDVNGNPAGLWRNSRNLSYARVFNGSHMLGVESGLPMLSLMEVFLNEKTLVNSSVTVIDGPVYVPGEGIIANSGINPGQSPSPTPVASSSSLPPNPVATASNLLAPSATPMAIPAGSSPRPAASPAPSSSVTPSPTALASVFLSIAASPSLNESTISFGSDETDRDKVGEAAAILLTILLVLGVLGLIIAFFLRYRRRTDGRTLLPDDEEDDEDIELGNVEEVFALGADSDDEET